jgi:hypothetical protein
MPSYESATGRNLIVEGPSQSIANKKKGEIETLISLMDAKIAAIESNTKMLIEKISPVLSLTPSKQVAEDRGKQGSTLGQVLAEYTYRLDNIIDSLGSTIEGVEL